MRWCTATRNDCSRCSEWFLTLHSGIKFWCLLVIPKIGEARERIRWLYLQQVDVLVAKASSSPFNRPKDFELKKYDDDGRFGVGDGKRVQLSFKISKDAGFHLLESPLSTDQVVQELDDKYHLQATVVESAQLHWWLRGFGDQISNIKLSKET